MKTALYDKHIQYGGNIIPFAGYLLPTHYTGINEEHKNVRKNAGLFDVSHMGEITIYGENSIEFLNMIATNNVNDLRIGQAQYTTLCKEKGGIIDDLIIYRDENHFLLVVNASNKTKVFNWLNGNSKKGVYIEDISEKTGLLSLQGPKSRNILHSFLGEEIETLKFYNFYKTKIYGFDVLISRTGYTGELGFELFVENSHLNNLWDLILEKGKSFGVLPSGLGCRDTLRLEMKYCLHGNDISDDINPIEAGLNWIVKFDKGFFIGHEACLRTKKRQTRKLICFEMLERSIPRKDCFILHENQKIGIVTSGTMSPSLNKGIGMGYVDISFSDLNQILTIDIRGRKKEAKIIKPPFYKFGTSSK
jgi:aminomethyltransferase